MSVTALAVCGALAGPTLVASAVAAPRTPPALGCLLAEAHCRVQPAGRPGSSPLAAAVDQLDRPVDLGDRTRQVTDLVTLEQDAAQAQAAGDPSAPALLQQVAAHAAAGARAAHQASTALGVVAAVVVQDAGGSVDGAMRSAQGAINSAENAINSTPGGATARAARASTALDDAIADLRLSQAKLRRGFPRRRRRRR